MTGWRRRLLLGGLYFLLFVVSLVVFVYWGFPWDRAARYLEATLAKRLDMDVSIGSLEPDWFTGVELHDVVLRTRKPDRQGRLRSFRADDVELRVSLGTIFGGDVDVDFLARLMGGTIEGQVYRTKQDTRLVARVAGVSPDEITTVRDMVGLPIKGALAGTIDVTLRDHKFAKASGTVDLVARNVVVGDGKARLRLKVKPQYAELQEFLDREDQGVALPPMKVGAFAMKLRVTHGMARIVQMGSSSEHVEVKGEGNIILRDPVTASEVGLYILYRFSEAYQNIDSEARSMLDSMSRSPHYQRAKRTDGFFGFRLQGVLRDRIRAFPSRENRAVPMPAEAPLPAAPAPQRPPPAPAPPPPLFGAPPDEPLPATAPPAGGAGPTIVGPPPPAAANRPASALPGAA